MEMQPLPADSTIYKENHHLPTELDVKLPTGEEILPLPNIFHNNTTIKEKKGNSEFVDEESNNGPLDFSLHRVQDIVFSDRSNSCCSKRGKVPRVKLTLRETKDQRERRLMKGRERMRNLRANETQEEREIRLLKARKCQERRRQRERSLESSFEREQRLAKARDRTRLRREQENPEQREKRLRTTRERLRLKRMSESQDERQKRLVVQRERKKAKYHRMTPEEKELLRFNERHSKQYKNDPKPERRQTRGICIKYDTFEDELDEALLKFQNETQHITSDGDDATWLAEPEVCLSVGSLDNGSPEKKEKEEVPAPPPPTAPNPPNPPNPPSTPVQFSAREASLPPPQDLQEQLSAHISNVVMNINDSTSSREGTVTDYKMSCYPPPPPLPNTQPSNESYCSYQCNNNQSDYAKNNPPTRCIPNSPADFNVFHGGGRENGAYQYCSPQGYPPPPQSVANQPTGPTSMGNEVYSQGNTSMNTQHQQQHQHHQQQQHHPHQPQHHQHPQHQQRPHQPHHQHHQHQQHVSQQQSSYPKPDAPLNLHHHPQMIQR